MGKFHEAQSAARRYLFEVPWRLVSAPVRKGGRWLTGEIGGPVKRRRPALGWLMAVMAMTCGTGNSILLVKSGATGMPALVTSFLTDVAASVTLWLVVRPKLRQVEWPVWRAALVFGCTSSLSIWSGQEAVHHMPPAMSSVLTLIIGPMMAALASGRRDWRIVSWVAVSVIGALLLYGGAVSHLSPMGIVAVLINGACYWAMARIFTGLGRREQGAGSNEAVFTASALSGLVTVPVTFIAFMSAHGPTVVTQHDMWATLGGLGVGALATISSTCMSGAWKRGLTISAHAELQPAKPVLSLGWSLVAGLKTPTISLDSVAGYILVLLGAGSVGRFFVEAKKKEAAAKPHLLEAADKVA
ncbi:hypothetical protein AB0L00_08825 [Actinoallomurus sp. NPDC052308]|uniref:hypothetical protein n=1 Tax=Actinoallomurus sp. NPDC052308 TaxID=3155530 RepID=UPI003428E3FD